MLYLGHKISAKEAKEYHLIGTIYKDVEEVWIYLRKLSQLSIKVYIFQFHNFYILFAIYNN